MEYAVVSVPAAPVRRKARHQSEMTNQLLFGESVQVLKEKKKLWVKVRSIHDDYEGWMTRNLLEETTEKEAKWLPVHVSTSLVSTVVMDERRINIPLASSFPGFTGTAGLLGSREYFLNGETFDRTSVSPGSDRIVELTATWLNAPYLWGGRTIFGVDCSGFVQVVFKMMGLDMPRDAWQQAGRGSTIKNLEDAVCGDLAFFDDKEEIVHVGILLGNDRIIHSSGRVRIDAIDKKGIINSETGKRSHSLQVIKRIFQDSTLT